MPGSANVNSRLKTRSSRGRSDQSRSSGRWPRWLSWLLFCCRSSSAKDEDESPAYQKNVDMNKCNDDDKHSPMDEETKQDVKDNTDAKHEPRQTNGNKIHASENIDSKERKPSLKRRFLNVICCKSAVVAPDETEEEEGIDDSLKPTSDVEEPDSTDKEKPLQDKDEPEQTMDKIKDELSPPATPSAPEQTEAKPADQLTSCHSSSEEDISQICNETVRNAIMKSVNAIHQDMMGQIASSPPASEAHRSDQCDIVTSSPATPPSSPPPLIMSSGSSSSDHQSVLLDTRRSRSLNDVISVESHSPIPLSHAHSAEFPGKLIDKRLQHLHGELHQSHASLNLLTEL